MRGAWRTLGCLLLVALSARAAAPQGAADSKLRVAATEAGAFEVELLTIFARVHNLELERVPATTPADALTALAQGRVRIAAGGVIAIGDQVDFSTEVFPTRLVALTRRPNPPVEFIEGLRGMRVGVPTGPVVTDALLAAKVRASSLDVFSTAAEALAALHAGRIGAAIVRLDEALRATGQDPDLQVGAGIGPRQSLAFAIRKGDTALLRSVNEHLTQLRSTTSWGRLVERHFGGEALRALSKARLGDVPAAQP